MSRILYHDAPFAWHAARTAMTGGAVAFLTVAITACGSSSSSSSASSSARSTAILGSSLRQDCVAVADVLSDGPDPGADPVGYAQAQVLPLRQLTISAATLRRDVRALAAAFQSFAAGGGGGGETAARGVTKAENAVNAICPQAAP